MQQPTRVHWIRLTLALGGLALAHALGTVSGTADFCDGSYHDRDRHCGAAGGGTTAGLLGAACGDHLAGEADAPVRSGSSRLAVCWDPRSRGDGRPAGCRLPPTWGAIAASGMAIAGASDGGSAQEDILLGNVRRGVLLSLAISFIMAAS